MPTSLGVGPSCRDGWCSGIRVGVTSSCRAPIQLVLDAQNPIISYDLMSMAYRGVLRLPAALPGDVARSCCLCVVRGSVILFIITLVQIIRSRVGIGSMSVCLGW